MAKTTHPKPRSVPGIAVDDRGDAVIDPTKNVLDLSEASNKRQDDLREAFEKLFAAELCHVKDMAQLRAEYDEKLRAAESKRIDAVRTIDVNAVRTEADRALQAIQALAATTSTNAETLRNALTTTAATIAKQTSDAAAATAKQTADTVSEITTRLAALEKSSYEGAGKQRVADPMMADFMSDMKAMMQAQATGTGKSAGVSWVGALIAGGISLIVGLLSIAGVLWAVLSK